MSYENEDCKNIEDKKLSEEATNLLIETKIDDKNDKNTEK